MRNHKTGRCCPFTAAFCMLLMVALLGGVRTCEAEFMFIKDDVPALFYQEPEHRGEIHTVEYETISVKDGSPITERYADIYLPYGYQEGEKYNVLVLFHGGGGDHHSFTSSLYNRWDGIAFRMANLYDNLIEQGLCDPFIVVSPWTGAFDYGANRIYDLSYEQMAYELRHVILPFLAENCYTFANGATEEDIRAAREHFGVGGVSNGSLYAYNSGMERCFDLFGNYICLSGNNQPVEVAKAVNEEPFVGLPVTAWFAGSGTTDSQQYNSYQGYLHIRDSSDRFTEGENCFYSDVYGGHNWVSWYINFYNALQLMFR